MPNKQDIKKYNEFLKELELKELKLSYMKASATQDFAPPASYNIGRKATYEKAKRGRFSVKQIYILKSIKEGKKEPGLIIEVHYILEYSSKKQISEKIFNIFSQGSLYLHTWPYFRQIVHQMTLYMDLPPLLLDTKIVLR